MKKMYLIILTLGFSIYMVSFGGPADKVINTGKENKVIIQKSNIKNKSEIKGVIFENIGINQQNIVHSIKIRKGTVIKNTTIHNKAHMTGTRVNNLGREQTNVFGGVDISDTETKKK